MGLVKCPDCGKEVSDKAPACIHCGRPKPGDRPPPPPGPPPSKFKPDKTLNLLGGLLLLGGLAGLMTGHAQYASLGFGAGLIAVAIGSVWGWLLKD